MKSKTANMAKSKMRVVEQRAIEIFGSREKALRWLDTPNSALGNQIPTELIETTDGYVIVMDELGRIEHGIFG